MESHMTKDQLTCVARHLRHYTQREFQGLKKTEDPCVGCAKTCTQVANGFDPWPAFWALSNETGITIPALRSIPKSVGGFLLRWKLARAGGYANPMIWALRRTLGKPPHKDIHRKRNSRHGFF